MPRSARGTSIGINVLAAVLLNTSAVPIRNIATRTSAMLTVSVTIDATSRASTTARIPSTTTTINRRSSRSARAPANRPNSSQGTCCNNPAAATSRGSWLCDATSSGPAASAKPSPRFETQDDASHQRKPAPSRLGAIASSILDTSRGYFAGAPLTTRLSRSAGQVRRDLLRDVVAVLRPQPGQRVVAVEGVVLRPG